MGQSERVGRLWLPPLDDLTEATLVREAKRRGGVPITSVIRVLLAEACELLRAAEHGADRN